MTIGSEKNAPTARATLADAQPGGRVRLGDQAELDRLEFQAWAEQLKHTLTRWGNGPGDVMPLFVSEVAGNYISPATQAAWEAWRHLSAQPSPGVQDALATARELLAAEYDKAGEKVFADRARKGRYDNDPDVRAIVAALAARQPVADQHPDDLAVDAFATAMKAKMADARAKGRGGWEDPAQCTADDLSRMLRDHVDKGDPRDVANFCMMLHQRGEAIAARQPVGEKPERRAPVQGYHGEAIPWRVHRLAWEAYAKKYGKQQSAERIAERGGFGCEEMDMFVPGWREMVEGSPAQAVDLEQFRQPVQDWLDDAQASMEEHGDYDGVLGHVIEEGTRLLALIDSQAVGNG